MILLKLYIRSNLSSVSKNDVVVVNIEHKLNNYCRFVPVVVTSVVTTPTGSIFGIRGWAWKERQHEYHKSSIVYYAKDYSDALNWIQNHKGITVRDFNEIKNSYSEE